MPEIALVIVCLAFLMPLGFVLIAAGGLAEERARHAALSLLAALALAALGYVAVGFGLQFGGVGLIHERPGYEELIWEWSALGPMWGKGWGMAGLTGWGLTGAAATAGALALAFANLPWVMTAAAIPLVGLRGRIPAWASGLIGLLMGMLIFPLAGNWIWGGGWLANLGHNLGLGHGLVDAGGSGQVHLLGAAATLAGILVFTSRRPRCEKTTAPIALPPVHLPMLAVAGAGFLLVGSYAWTLTNPLLDLRTLNLPLLALNGILAATAGCLLPLIYTWFIAGSADPLMATRGFAAGAIAVAAAAPFIPPWAALAIGAAIGLFIPLAVYVVDHVLRWDDATAALTVHGLAGALGLLAVGLFADGRGGQGWNGIGADSYLGVAGQGVTGMLASGALKPDWPAQMQAQLVGVAALTLLGFFAAWLATAPLAVVFRLLSRMVQPAPAALSTVPAPRRAPSADDAALRSDARPPTAVASQPAQATGGIDAEPAQALEVRGAPNVEATT
jgi:Amt family ammonium transporter